LTPAEAKEYTLSHLPCTMRAVTELFKLDLEGHVYLDQIVGMRPSGLGYKTLVFYFRPYQHSPETVAKVYPYIKWWFENKLNGIVGPVTRGEITYQVWWVQVPIEIKEDRDGLA
jgi:hypothetical protein